MKILFIINPGSGNGEVSFKDLIVAHFKSSEVDALLYELPEDCSLDKLKAVIDEAGADRVAAVGGDGTLKLVAECLIGSNTPIAIIPAGSANGMAKEIGIPTEVELALDTAFQGTPKKIHAIKVNGELCIHLADIGFNAYIVKKFSSLDHRGMWGYTKAAWSALWNHRKMHVEFSIEGKTIRSEAAMVVIANATMYGTGLKINPEGKLDDDLFEIVLVKKYSVMEILKMRFTKMALNPKNIELFQTTNLKIKTKHKAHFQVDGEYLGKVSKVEAELISQSICIVV